MDGAAGVHPGIQRVGILDELVLEQRETELPVSHCHSSRLSVRCVPRQRRREKLKSAGRPAFDGLSQRRGLGPVQNVRFLGISSQGERIELMSRSDWLVGGDRREAAAERIYAAADRSHRARRAGRLRRRHVGRARALLPRDDLSPCRRQGRDPRRRGVSLRGTRSSRPCGRRLTGCTVLNGSPPQSRWRSDRSGPIRSVSRCSTRFAADRG